MADITTRILAFEFHEDHITFVKSYNGSSKPTNFIKDEVKLELSVSRIFHKALNKTRVEGLFEKNDLETFGYILYKLLCLSNIEVDNFVCGEIKAVVRDSSFVGIIPLRFGKGAEYLATLPWEYLQILENINQGYETFYLAANREKSFDLVRHIETGKERVLDPSFSEQKKLNILQIICQSDRGGLDVPDFQDTYRSLSKDFTYPDGESYIQLLSIENPSKTNFRKKIKEMASYFEGEYVVHFYGHARLENDQAEIALVAADLSEEWVSHEEFKDFFDGSEGFKKPLMVVLQACESGQVDSRGDGFAPSLIRSNIPYVIGMQNEVTTDVSNAFFHKFYHSICSGKNIFRAVTDGRVYLGCEYKKENPEAKHKHYTDNSFGTPVLFSNTLEALQFFPEQLQPDEKETRHKKCEKCPKVYDYMSDLENCADPLCRGRLYYVDTRKVESTSAPSAANSVISRSIKPNALDT